MLEEEAGGISPSVSQTWDLETMSTQSHHYQLEELPEEPGHTSCLAVCHANFRRIGQISFPAPVLIVKSREFYGKTRSSSLWQGSASPVVYA